jgi:hypothetical protein
MSDEASRKANRRRSPRKQPKRSTKVRCVPNRHGLGDNVAVQVLDVSETGVRLILRQAATVGQEVEVVLEATTDRRPHKLVAQVIWCVPTADGTYCVGAHFEKPLPYAALQALTYF